MGRKIIRGIGVAFLIAAILIVTIPAGSTNAVVLDKFQMDHDKLDKYEGTDVTVSIPADVKAIGEEAFAGNSTLATVDTGINTKSIGHGAFSNCPYLYSVTTHDNLESIDSAAFAGDENLVSVTIGGNVDKIGYGVFAGCNNLKNITISRNNNHFIMSGAGLYNSDGDMLYAYLGGADATYFKMPNSVTNISKYCFWGNETLDSVSISSYVVNIPAYSFSNCKNLKTVNIPYSVTAINAKAFENCVSLVDVSIPPSVTYIDPTAFDGCGKLNIIADPGTTAYNFFQNFDKSDVANTEYGDTKDVIIPKGQDIISNTSTGTTSTGTGNGVEEPAGDGINYQDSPEYSFQVGMVDAKSDPSNVEYMPTVDPLSILDDSSVIAKTIVVGGRAVLFIDSEQEVHEGVLDNPMGDTDTTVDGNYSDDTNGQIIYDSSKGGYLPKYTRVGSKISAQAYYASQSMDDYSIPNGITEIGDFAYARSNLETIDIPQGVTRIGYGAFYHCDNLTDVNIPSTVSDIDNYAFVNTPYMEAFKSNISGDGFLVVGDGILLAYSGPGGVVSIPDTVKKISPGVFMDRKDITGVNLPSSLTEVGEDAFRGCSSLTTVTGGENVTRIEDRAYMGCPLAVLEIPSSVNEVGLRAVDFSDTGKTDATKVVVFEGNSIPAIINGSTSERLENDNYRRDALNNVLFAVVNDDVNQFENTILDNSKLGFSGIILTREKDGSGNETGNLLVKKNYIFSEEILNSLPETVAIKGKNYSIKDKTLIEPAVNSRSDKEASSEVITLLNGSVVDNTNAHFSENEKVGNLLINRSDAAKQVLTENYAELFGSDNTPDIASYEITLTDSTGTLPINKFGNSTLTVTIPLPEEVKGDTYHVITRDSDGQLEEVSASLNETNNTISFKTSHLSYYGIYATDGNTSKSILKNGATIKNYKMDNSPDTGDFSLPVKYVIAFLLVSAGLFMIIYRKKCI